MEKNVFRVLDCKNAPCKDIVSSLNLNGSHICDDCKKHFQEVKDTLRLFGIIYKVNPLLVRGLDYYTRTVFEITHSGLGAQDALGAGGRYDNLVEELGGPNRGAVGFALGVERLLLANGDGISAQDRPIVCYIIPLGGAALKKCVGILRGLREAGISADMDYLEGSLKASLRRADKTASKFCLIVGDNELVKGSGILKNMRESVQEDMPFDKLTERLKC